MKLDRFEKACCGAMLLLATLLLLAMRAAYLALFLIIADTTAMSVVPAMMPPTVGCFSAAQATADRNASDAKTSDIHCPRLVSSRAALASSWRNALSRSAMASMRSAAPGSVTSYWAKSCGCGSGPLKACVCTAETLCTTERGLDIADLSGNRYHRRADIISDTLPVAADCTSVLFPRLLQGYGDRRAAAAVPRRHKYGCKPVNQAYTGHSVYDYACKTSHVSPSLMGCFAHYYTTTGGDLSMPQGGAK